MRISLSCSRLIGQLSSRCSLSDCIKLILVQWYVQRVELYRCAKVEASMAKTPNATYPSEKSAGGAHGSGLTCHFVRRVCNHVDFREALDPYA